MEVDPCQDRAFGPSVLSPECRGGFDFTVFFEDTIFAVVPAAVFLLLAPFRTFQLWKRPVRVKKSNLYVAKLSLGVVLSLTQIAGLIVVASIWNNREPSATASAVLDFLASFALVGLLQLEHVRSIRPSFIVSAYLLVSALLDISRVRTAWLRDANTRPAVTLSLSLGFKLFILLLETVEKRRLLPQSDKDISIESTSGPFNRGLFVWLNGLLKTGFTNLLTLESLPSINEKLATDKIHDRFDTAWKRGNPKGKYALLISILRCLKGEVLAIALPRLALVGFEVAQPFLITEAVTYVESPNEDVSPNRGYGLIGAFALVFISAAITRSWYEHLGYRAMAMLRGGMISMIYDKMMTLPIGNVNESGAMSIMGSDVESLVESFFMLICYTWANGIQITIAIWLLSSQLGAVCVAPIIVAVTFTLMATRLGKYVTIAQKRWLEAIEKRINFTSEIFGSIKSVKMLGLTDKMATMIEKMRRDEIIVMKKSRLLWTINVCIIHIPNFLSQFLTFAAYAIAAKIQGNQPLSVSQAVMALSLLNILIFPLSYLLEAIPQCFTAMGCIDRIQQFLAQDSKSERRHLEGVVNFRPPPGRGDDHRNEKGKQAIPLVPVDAGLTAGAQNRSIALKGCSFGWDQTSRPTVTATLGQPSQGSLTIVVGPVGSGKSTFLKALIGETYSLNGELSLSVTRIAFCDQTSWLTNSMIRSNIIGESGIYDEEWYNTVVHACDLETDFAQHYRGDQTVVGSRGVKLSGGQKQRIAIARAVYARARIAIFDDIFSGLDKATEQTVFERVFGRDGLLRRSEATVILSTHSVKHLPAADHIIALGQNGTIVEQGNFGKLKGAGGYVQSLDLTAGTSRSSSDADEREPGSQLTKKLTATAEDAEDLKQKTDASIWLYYARALGWFRIAVFVVLLAIQAGCGSFRYVWLTWWSSTDGADASGRLGYWLGIYGTLGVIEVSAMAGVCFYIYLNVMPRTSRTLHSAVLDAAMSAPMSYLSRIETGVLVNRFSQDMRLVDMILPRALTATGFQAVDCIAKTGLVIAAVPYIGAVIPFLVLILWMIQRFYLRTSQQLRLLEIESKAPLFSHFIESLSGLVTIRSFGWTSVYMNKSMDLINVAQRPYYLLLCIQRWLVCVLDLVVAGLTILMVGLAVALRTRIKPGLLGVSLIMLMQLGDSLAHLVQFWTQLETSLGAVSRIKHFEEDTPSECLPAESTQPGDDWPRNGGLVFKDASLSYKANAIPVVRNININIQPGQKFGLVGRTGRQDIGTKTQKYNDTDHIHLRNSGKSSMVLSLLRLVDISGGVITIDGEDLTTLPRPLIRKRLNCLTQEPFMFKSSIRQNADPLEESSDADIRDALQRVGLWHIIANKLNSDNSSLLITLDTTMNEELLSHGQRQLFCLARALLRKSSVLILDEPTSSVDSKTDARMQAVIRSEFSHCTIITIAHRLDSLLDFDTVAVMDKGELIEIGNPRTLLGSKETAFSKLYYSGKANGQNL